MLCSAAELELSNDHEGIIDLPADTPIGKPFGEVLGLNDPMIEINLTPNRAELRQVVGSWRTEAELAAKAQQLRGELALGAILITRAEEGMSLFTDAGALNIPAEAREVYDVSGAGDTVIATLGALLGAHADLASAVRIANHAAGIVVGKLGAVPVYLDELREALAHI